MEPSGQEGANPNPTRPPRGLASDETIAAENGDETLISASKQELDAQQYSRSFIGKTLGDYRILREIGHGSMGIVFAAQTDRLDRVVALKVLPPSLSVTETVIKRFMREAQSVAKLDHENIVQIYATGDQDGVYYYAMQFIEGSPLDDVLKERKLTFEESAKITALAARALFFAHENAIIHRDVKPANIILSYKDRPVLTDFGLARPEKAATLTASGALVGTPIYMSPEQVRGERANIDRRTDIYSLGITFYEMLTGTTPFEAESTQEILNKIEFHDPRPARKVLADVPKALETICHKAIEKEADRRYQTAIEFALDLERFLSGEQIQARPTPLHTRLIKKAVQHRMITSLGALLTVAVVLVFFATRKSSENKESATSAQYSKSLIEGSEYLRRGEHTAALRSFDQAVFLRPKLAASYVERGKAYVTLENHESAVEDFERALELDPGNVHARMWRGISRVRYGSDEEFSAGFKDLEEMLGASPNDTETLFEVARVCLDLAANRNIDRAKRDNFISFGYQYVTKLLDLDPNNDQALVIQGLLLEEQGLLQEALSIFERASKINPRNSQAMALALAKRPEPSPPSTEDDTQATTAEDVAPWQTLLLAQGVSWASKQISVDQETLSSAVDALALWDSSEDPEDQTPAAAIVIEDLLAEADILWSEDQRAQSAPIYEDVLAKNPRLAEPNNRLAEYYLADLKDIAKAQKPIGQALEIAPTNARSLLIALEVYNSAGERGKLERVVRTIRQYYPFVDANVAYRKAVDALGATWERAEQDG